MTNESLSEKVSVNINSSTLSSIDLLVDNGYYSNRSDFINQALRSALQQQQSTLDRIISQNTDAAEESDPWFIGVYGLTEQEISRLFDAGKHIRISGYGVLVIDKSCPEEKVFAVVDSIRVKGRTLCAPLIKQHYGIK